MQIILINGKPGTGKSSVSRKLLGLLIEPAAWIDTDDLMRVRPFDPKTTFEESLKRALLLVEDFNQKNYKTIIVSGCVHSKELWEHVKLSINNDQVTYVHLHAKTTIIDQRKRDQGYSEKKARNDV